MPTILEGVLAMDVDAVKAGAYELISSYNDWWISEFTANPAHIFVETLLICMVVYILFFTRSYKPGVNEVKLSREEEDELIADWFPEPMVPKDFDPTDEATPFSKDAIVEKVHSDGVHIDVTFYDQPNNGSKEEKEGVFHEKLVDFSSFDMLCLSSHESVQDVIKQTLNDYGCGSCGPRGFYGTIDVHLALEKNLAEFFGAERGIIFSDNNSTVSSVIPACAKRGDLIFMDEGCYSAVKTGVLLSRARVIIFKHNDLNDLREKLEKVSKEDKRRGTGPEKQRRFLVVEGLYRNHGDLAPLPELLRIKRLYGLRLVVDDSYGIGVLGKTGRGAIEHFDVPINDIDLFTCSLESVLGSVGGFLVGSAAIVDHLILSAAGYVFSASAPAYTATAASEALRLLDSKDVGQVRLEQTQENISIFVDSFSNGITSSGNSNDSKKKKKRQRQKNKKAAAKNAAAVEKNGAIRASSNGLDLFGAAESPILHFRLSQEYSALSSVPSSASSTSSSSNKTTNFLAKYEADRERSQQYKNALIEDRRVLQRISQGLVEEGYLVSVSQYEERQPVGKSPLPSIRVVIRSGHSEEDLTGMALSLNEKAISILASSS